MNADLILKSNSIFFGQRAAHQRYRGRSGRPHRLRRPPLTRPLRSPAPHPTLELGGQLVMPGFHDAPPTSLCPLMFSKYMFMMLGRTPAKQTVSRRMRPL